MKSEKETPLSLLQKMKQKVREQKTYGGDFADEPAKISVRTCPNCGGGRAHLDGLTCCAYCGFEFLSVKLTDGVYIKKEDNSPSL